MSMNNPFQEQLLKAGLVSEQQVKKANREKFNKQKLQRSKKNTAADTTHSKAQQVLEAKTKRDRELNQRKQEQARKKAISIEINQLILNNRIKRDKGCDIAYNFEHQNKIKRIYINPQMKNKISQGKLGIARIEGNYELVPLEIAEKIKQRNEKRIVIYGKDIQPVDENDGYADYQIPDDLMW